MLSTLMCICILVPGKHEHTGMLCAKCTDYIKEDIDLLNLFC